MAEGEATTPLLSGSQAAAGGFVAGPTVTVALAPIPEHVGPAEVVKRLRPALIVWLVLSLIGLLAVPLACGITGDIVQRSEASADIVIITYLSTPGYFGEILAVVVVALILAFNDDLSPSRAQVVVVLSGLASVLSSMNVISVGITYIRALLLTASSSNKTELLKQVRRGLELHDAADRLVHIGYPIALAWFILHASLGAYITSRSWQIAKLSERTVRP